MAPAFPTHTGCKTPKVRKVCRTTVGTALVTRSQELSKVSPRLKGLVRPKSPTARTPTSATLALSNWLTASRALPCELRRNQKRIETGAVTDDSELNMFRDQIIRHPDLRYDMTAHKRPLRASWRPLLSGLSRSVRNISSARGVTTHTENVTTQSVRIQRRLLLP